MLALLTQVVLPFLAMLSLLIAVHELGHYLAARCYGLAVARFSLGFGPPLLKLKDRLGTEWVLAALPLGGYVAIAEASRPMARAVVAGAGPAANLVLAALLLFVQAWGHGVSAPPSVVAGVLANSPAARAGLLPGDRLLAMNGRAVRDFDQIQRYVAIRLAQPVTFLAERDGRRFSVTVEPVVVNLPVGGGRTEPVGLTGLLAGPPEHFRPGLVAAAAMAVDDTLYMLAGTLEGARQIFSGERSYASLMGVLGIAGVTGQVVETSGAWAMLGLAALISINVALVNLLPLPALDGGRIAVVVIEALARRPLPDRFHNYANAVGFGLLAAILALTTMNDLRFLV